MWVLLLILLTAPPGARERSVLETFRTESDCLTIRDGVEREMRKIYPIDEDYTVVCEYRATPALPERPEAPVDPAPPEEPLIPTLPETPRNMVFLTLLVILALTLI